MPLCGGGGEGWGRRGLGAARGQQRPPPPPPGRSDSTLQAAGGRAGAAAQPRPRRRAAHLDLHLALHQVGEAHGARHHERHHGHRAAHEAPLQQALEGALAHGGRRAPARPGEAGLHPPLRAGLGCYRLHGAAMRDGWAAARAGSALVTDAAAGDRDPVQAVVARRPQVGEGGRAMKEELLGCVLAAVSCAHGLATRRAAIAFLAGWLAGWAGWLGCWAGGRGRRPPVCTRAAARTTRH